MNADTSLCIFLSIAILSITGCLYGSHHDEEVTVREREKTKQMEIQYRLDSVRIIHSIKGGSLN